VPGKATSEQESDRAVVGFNVGDRQTHYCVLDRSGEVVVEGVVATKEASLRAGLVSRSRVIFL